MAKLQTNYELISDKSKNAVTSDEFIKHGDKWLDTVINKFENVCLTPDDFEGTDTEKIKQAIDACDAHGGTIFINRTYTITENITITHESNVAYAYISFIGSGANAAINMQGYHINGAPIGTWHCGTLIFSNLTIYGTDYFIVGDYLIKNRFNNCVFRGFKRVVTSEVTYLSQYYFNQCHFWDIKDSAIYVGKDAFDLHFNLCTCEGSNNFFYQTAEGIIYKCDIIGCCIEYNTGTGVKFGTGFNLTVKDCYFEGNDIDVDISDSISARGLEISNNTTDRREANKYMIKLPPYSQGEKFAGRIVNNVQRGIGALLHFDESSDKTLCMDISNNFYINEYYGSIRNNVVTYVQNEIEKRVAANINNLHSISLRAWSTEMTYTLNPQDGEYLFFGVTSSGISAVTVIHNKYYGGIKTPTEEGEEEKYGLKVSDNNTKVTFTIPAYSSGILFWNSNVTITAT